LGTGEKSSLVIERALQVYYLLRGSTRRTRQVKITIQLCLPAA